MKRKVYGCTPMRQLEAERIRKNLCPCCGASIKDKGGYIRCTSCEFEINDGSFDPSTGCAIDRSPMKRPETLVDALAVPPFERDYGLVKDACGSVVLVCYEDDSVCDKRYANEYIDRNPNFVCSCGRLGQHMEVLTPERAGL